MMRSKFVNALLMLWSSTAAAGAIPVELQQTEQGWQLLRDGKPYIIRGAGGDAPLDQLAAAGANSIRTWGADDLEKRLDEAEREAAAATQAAASVSARQQELAVQPLPS